MSTFIATLTHVEAAPGGKGMVCTAIGEQGDTVKFSVTVRTGLTLSSMLESTDDDVMVEVEGWQALSVT